MSDDIIHLILLGVIAEVYLQISNREPGSSRLVVEARVEVVSNCICVTAPCSLRCATIALIRGGKEFCERNHHRGS